LTRKFDKVPQAVSSSNRYPAAPQSESPAANSSAVPDSSQKKPGQSVALTRHLLLPVAGLGKQAAYHALLNIRKN
jgi:hypothetical protein